MNRLKALFFIAFAAGIAVIGIIPGCDELVTNEYIDTTFITEIVNDSACVAACHSDENFEMLIAIRQWQNSGHNNTDYQNNTLFDQSAVSCGPECHTMEGFLDSLDGLDPATEYPLELRCTSCHAVHTTWDFSLRDTSAVILAGNHTFDYGAGGNSNICARCHRAYYDVINQVAPGVLINDDWLTMVMHNAHEAQMIMGVGGYEHAGYTYRKDSTHANAIKGCVGCHQEYDQGFELGGHSLNIRDGNGNALVEGCNITGCHAGDPYTDDGITSLQNELYQFYMPGLRNTLVAAGLLDDATGLPPDSFLFITNADSAGALYNYLYLNADRSQGMHNYLYSVDLVTNSIGYLIQSPPE